MTNQEDIEFLPYEEAARIVAAIQEEEDIQNPDHRILTVYSQDDKELCWFDFDDVMTAIGPVDKEQEKEIVSEYILNHLPGWVLDI